MGAAAATARPGPAKDVFLLWVTLLFKMMGDPTHQPPQQSGLDMSCIPPTRCHSTRLPAPTHLLQLPHFVRALAVLRLQGVHLRWCGACASLQPLQQVLPLSISGRCGGQG